MAEPRPISIATTEEITYHRFLTLLPFTDFCLHLCFPDFLEKNIELHSINNLQNCVLLTNLAK
jgi:hypothetical protein